MVCLTGWLIPADQGGCVGVGAVGQCSHGYVKLICISTLGHYFNQDIPCLLY